jgi:hypothetical protein
MDKNSNYDEYDHGDFTNEFGVVDKWDDCPALDFNNDMAPVDCDVIEDYYSPDEEMEREIH